MSDYGHWDTSIVGEFDPLDFFGFIYEIEEKSTGRCYIGKKQLTRRRKKTKSNSSRWEESKWREYTSSSLPLNESIAQTGKEGFIFRIVSLCVGRCQLTYEENQAQFLKDVLRAKLPNGERKYYNRTIGHLLFAGLEKQTEESIEKRSRALRGRTLTEEHKFKIAESHKGMRATAETKLLMSVAKLGKKRGPHSLTRNAHFSESMKKMWAEKSPEQRAAVYKTKICSYCGRNGRGGGMIQHIRKCSKIFA